MYYLITLHIIASLQQLICAKIVLSHLRSRSKIPGSENACAESERYRSNFSGASSDSAHVIFGGSGFIIVLQFLVFPQEFFSSSFDFYMIIMKIIIRLLIYFQKTFNKLNRMILKGNLWIILTISNNNYSRKFWK